MERARRWENQFPGVYVSFAYGFTGKTLPKTGEGVALALAAVREGKTPVVIGDHADRTGGATHILEELIRQNAENFCIATLRDERAIEDIQNEAKVGEEITLDLAGGFG